MITNKLVSYLDVLLRAQSTEECLDVCTAFLDDAGFHAYNYGFADTRNHDTQVAPIEFVSTLKGDWLDHYNDQRYDLLDPGVENIKKGNTTPIELIPTYLGSQAEKGSPHRQYYAELHEAGVEASVIAPLRTPSDTVDGFAGIGLLSEIAPKEFSQIWLERSSEVMIFLNLLHDKISPEMQRRVDRVPAFSAREADCLKLLSEGYRPAEMGDKLCIATVTVNFHIKAIRAKLTAQTNAEAVAKGYKYGLL